jgi:protein phosphatase
MSVDWNQSLQCAALTDIGMRRSNNQDSHAVVLAGDVENWYSRGHLFIVADGMGAHAAGELASKSAVDGIPHLYHKHHELSPPEALQKAVIETNAEIHRRGQANPDFHNMGTTSSMLVLLPQGALVAHVGDSRIYRLRGDTFRQLTFDHSLVWEMKHSGQVPEGVDVNTLAPKNVITRSLGPNEKVKVDFEGPYPVAQGDTFLLCSDGLTGRVEDAEIAAILRTLPAKEAARALIDLANLRGGPDNITVIVVRIINPSIATANAQIEPLVLGADLAEKKDVHLAVWIITGVCFLSALVMAVVGLAPAALAVGCMGIVAATVGVLQKFGNLRFGKSKEVALSDGRRLGGGPYTETKLPTGRQLIDAWQRIVDKQVESGKQKGRDYDWAHMQRELQLATTVDSKDPTAAARRMAGLLHHMMQQVRQQQKAAASDSNVDLV